MSILTFKSRIYPIATLTSLMVVVNLLEIFLVLPIPFFKIGFANIVPVYFIIKKEYFIAFFINILRVVIASLISGKIFSFLFILSFSGIFISTIIMIIFKSLFLEKISITTISMLGSAVNNFVQYLLFFILVNSGLNSLMEIVNYSLTILMILSVCSGFIIGLLSSKINNINLNFK